VRVRPWVGSRISLDRSTICRTAGLELTISSLEGGTTAEGVGGRHADGRKAPQQTGVVRLALGAVSLTSQGVAPSVCGRNLQIFSARFPTMRSALGCEVLRPARTSLREDRTLPKRPAQVVSSTITNDGTSSGRGICGISGAGVACEKSLILIRSPKTIPGRSSARIHLPTLDGGLACRPDLVRHGSGTSMVSMRRGWENALRPPRHRAQSPRPPPIIQPRGKIHCSGFQKSSKLTCLTIPRPDTWVMSLTEKGNST